MPRAKINIFDCAEAEHISTIPSGESRGLFINRPKLLTRRIRIVTIKTVTNFQFTVLYKKGADIMKKLISLCLVFVIFVMPFSLSAFAAEMEVIFTSNSNFKVGGRATVDVIETAAAVFTDAHVTSDLYNAALDQNMTYLWKCSNGPDKTGKSVTWTEEDAGREYVCRVSFYSDMDCTQFVDYIESEPFTVTSLSSPKITTENLPAAYVGAEYSCRIECTDLSASFFENSGSMLAEFGLQLTEDGEIKGTPTKAGDCVVNITASGEVGNECAEFILNIYSDPEPSLEILQNPNKLTYFIGESFDPTGLKVKITTFDGSYYIAQNGDMLEYSTEPFETEGEIKVRLVNSDLEAFITVTVKSAPKPDSTDQSDTSGELTDGGEDGSGDADANGKTKDSGMPWWGVLLIAIGAAAAGAGVTLLILRLKR